jgi:hypothetical protein
MEMAVDAHAEFAGIVVQMIGNKSVSLVMLTNKDLTMQ